MQQNALIETLVEKSWEVIVAVCTDVLSHCDLFGIEIGKIQNPDIRKIHSALRLGVLPIFETLETMDLHPDLGRKMLNGKQYVWHLRNIIKAIDDQDPAAFEAAVENLRRESMV